jgi:hypothetical protein
VAGRSTAAEKALRVQTVHGLLVNGKSRSQIIQYAAEKWKISERAADEYIKWSRELIEKDCELSRQSFLAEVLGRLRTYEQMAAKRGQLQVATNCVRLQVELVGLTK